MKWLWLAVLAMFATMSASAPAATADRYAEGQVWEYKTRPQDTGSLLKIQKMEDGGAIGTIYHISIIGIMVAGKPNALPHTPVSRATLDASVTRLSDAKRDWPDAAPGIAQWRADNGGVFTVSVADIAGFVEKALLQQNSPASDAT